MDARFLSPEAAMRLLELSKTSYRPREIVKLKEQIERETRLAKLRAVNAGVVDQEGVQKIVGMRLRLDGLYAAWAQGDIG